MESGKNRPSTSGYSLREREKQLYTDETTPTHSSPDVEYTPREKKDYFDNEDIIPLKRVDSSCEIISIENITPSPKNVEATSHESDGPPLQEEIQSNNISSSSEENFDNDVEMKILKIKEEADQKVIELKSRGARKRKITKENLRKIEEETKNNLRKIEEETKNNLRKIEEETKNNLRRIDEETKKKLQKIDEKTEEKLIRNREKYEIAIAELRNRKKAQVLNE